MQGKRQEIADRGPRPQPDPVAHRLRRNAGIGRNGLGCVVVVAALQKALAVDGKQADWRAALGRVLLAKGDATAALAEAQAALKLVSNNGAAKLVAADALAAKGDIDLAIEAYEQAHGYARTDPTPLVHAAKACLAQARPTTARAFADRATQSFPKHGPGWEVLGDVHAHAKETAAARKAYLHALKSTGTDRARVQKKLAALK